MFYFQQVNGLVVMLFLCLAVDYYGLVCGPLTYDYFPRGPLTYAPYCCSLVSNFLLMYMFMWNVWVA